MYEYRCRLIRVVDGNTIEADIDLGFNVWTRQKIRLFGIGCTSLQTGNKDEIDKEKSQLQLVLPKEFYVQTILNKRGKIGRVMGILLRDNSDGSQLNINDYLLANGAKKKVL